MLIYSPSACKINPLLAAKNMDEVGINRTEHYLYMKTATKVFKIDRKYITYEGVASVRGIMADVWIRKMDPNKKVKNILYDLVKVNPTLPMRTYLLNVISRYLKT